MSLHTWHLFGVALPYVLIATALWGLGAGAVKDAVGAGLLPQRTRRGVPSVPLAYAVGFLAVAFLYGCAFDRGHAMVAVGAAPSDAGAPSTGSPGSRGSRPCSWSGGTCGCGGGPGGSCAPRPSAT